MGALERLRRWILGILLLGLIGTEIELALLEHYDEPLQWIPLLIIAVAVAMLAWNMMRRDAASFRAVQGMMVLCVLAGFAGVALHFDGAAEFQREIDPSIGRWELVTKVMRAKDPPVLAPGVMLQLGLLGLAFTYGNRQAAADGCAPNE